MKKQHITLTETDKTYLEDLINKGARLASQYKRALALLELNRGKTYRAVAETVCATHHAVSTWAKKYNSTGLEFLTDKPRPGRPPTISGTARAKITALACSDPPAGYSQWSLRLLADRAVEMNYVESISHAQVGHVLKKTTSNHT